MANVWAVIEYQHIAANGAAGSRVLSEHPTPEAAITAKQAIYAERPELVGCLALRFGKAEQPQPVPVPAVAVEPVVVAEEPIGEAERGGVAAAGDGRGGDGVRRQGAGGGHRPPLPRVQ